MKIQRSKRNMEVRRARAADVQKERAKRTDIQQLELIERRTKLGMGESRREVQRLQLRIAKAAANKDVLTRVAETPAEESSKPKRSKAKDRRQAEKHTRD